MERLIQRFGAAVQQVCRRVEDCVPQGGEALRSLAMELAVEANARRAAAERILCELEAAEKADPEKAEKKDKKNHGEPEPSESDQ